MELLVILLPIFIFSYLIGRHHIFPYFDGTKQIDHLKYPILARAQRIHRYRNVKAREIEARTMWTHFDTKRLEVTKAIDKAIEHNRIESQADHWTEVQEWEEHFRAITAEEDARKAREEAARIAEDLRKKKAIEAELREKELEIWTANEKARIARYKAEEAARQAEEDRRVTALLEQREKDIQSLAKHKVFEHDPDNQTMFVNVHGLYIRKLPTVDSRIVDNLSTNSGVTVNGWISHEVVWGNPIWFRLANGQGWIWSGGVNSQSTTGLENLNYMKSPGDSHEIRSFDGSSWITTEPSQLQRLIDDELASLKREKQQIEDKKSGVMRIDATMITADKISTVVSKTKISTGGYTLDSNGFHGPDNTLLTPAQVQELVKDTAKNYQDSNRRKSFWGGTTFDDDE